MVIDINGRSHRIGATVGMPEPARVEGITIEATVSGILENLTRRNQVDAL